MIKEQVLLHAHHNTTTNLKGLVKRHLSTIPLGSNSNHLELCALLSQKTDTAQIARTPSCNNMIKILEHRPA